MIRKQNAVRHENSDVCIAYEYPTHSSEINVAKIEIRGRYPENGCVVNDVCQELVYVARGTAIVTVQEHSLALSVGDVILLEKGEKYHWEGDCELIISAAPAWYPEQHRIVD